MKPKARELLYKLEGWGGMMEKPGKGKRFDPEKYGMIFCPDCRGSGKSFNDAEGANICRVCGGFGLTKKRDNSFGNRVYGSVEKLEIGIRNPKSSISDLE